MNKYKKYAGHILHFIRKNGRDNISAVSGQSAFYIILSFVPFLMFAFAILSYLGLSSDWYNHYISNFLPIHIDEYVSNIIRSAYDSAVSMAFTTIIVALWSAGRGIYSITQGILVIYKSAFHKNWLVKRLLAMFYTLIMFICIVLSFGMLILAQVFNDVILQLVPDIPYFVNVLYGLRYIIFFILLVLLLSIALKSLLYFNIADKELASFRMQLPGAMFAALSWTLLTAGMSLYVKVFGGFSLYGSLGTAAIIMIWLYFAMYLFLCGIQFNYIYRFKIRKKLVKKKKKRSKSKNV